MSPRVLGGIWVLGAGAIAVALLSAPTGSAQEASQLVSSAHRKACRAPARGRSAAAPPPVARTVLVSATPEGDAGDKASAAPEVDASGNLVAFHSSASNLVPDDTNSVRDVFVHDRVAGTTVRASVAADGSEANGPSFSPKLSENGRYVVFLSAASNLVPGDTNRRTDAFRRDLESGETSRVSVGAGGAQPSQDVVALDVDADGTVVAFLTDASNLVPGDTNRRMDVFVRDLAAGETTRPRLSNLGAREPNGDARAVELSASGRYVALSSAASNLVSGDTNGVVDVFVFDRKRLVTRRVNVSATGAQANDRSFRPSLSSSGWVVAFRSAAKNLVPGDTNGLVDVFVRDLATGRTIRVNVSSAGAEANRLPFRPTVSGSGRYITFASAATNLVVRDTNGETDVFVHDRSTHRTTRASLTPSGGQANGCSYRPRISANGGVVVFASYATNLARFDRNGTTDVFVRSRP